jgi:hypothetical protein
MGCGAGIAFDAGVAPGCGVLAATTLLGAGTADLCTARCATAMLAEFCGWDAVETAVALDCAVCSLALPSLDCEARYRPPAITENPMIAMYHSRNIFNTFPSPSARLRESWLVILCNRLARQQLQLSITV